MSETDTKPSMPNIITIGSNLDKVKKKDLPALRAAALRRDDREMVRRIDAMKP